MDKIFLAAYLILVGPAVVTKDKSPHIASQTMEVKSNSRALENEDKNSPKDKASAHGEVEK